ncbi:hypothetical protein DRQ36_05680 [bacterium]|nr:MAG: hypothetical protein DRQ36_05680 [bacterium]
MRRAIVFALILISAAAFATKYAGEFTDLGVGVRPAGMGGSFSCFDSDLQALWWNPAGLTGLSERPQFYLMHAELYNGLDMLDAGAIGKLLGETQWAAGFFRHATEDIPFTDTTMFYDYGPDRIPGTGDPGEGNGSWDPGEQMRPDAIYYRSEGDYLFTIGAGRRFGEKLLLGASFKHIQSYIGEYSAFGFGLDVGALYEYRPNLTFGAAMRDVTAMHIRYSTGRWEQKLPSLWWGAKYDIPIESVRGGLALTGEFETRFENFDGIINTGRISYDPHIGAEFTLLRRVFLRAGIDRKDLTAGAGLRIAFFRVDYAFVSNKELDNTHRIGLTLEIPKIERKPKPPEEPGIQKPPDSSDETGELRQLAPLGEQLAEIYFDEGLAELGEDAKVTLSEVCAVWQEHPTHRIYIEGHTDSVNIKTPEYPDNYALSKARARAVMNYLIECSVPAHRIEIDWFGPDRPKYDMSTPETRAKNRRVEIYMWEP